MSNKKLLQSKELKIWVILILIITFIHFPLKNNSLNIHFIFKEVEKIEIMDVRNMGKSPSTEITFTYITDRDVIGQFTSKVKHRFNFNRYKGEDSKREYMLTFYYNDGSMDSIGYDKENKVLFYPWVAFKLKEGVYRAYDELIENSST